MPPYSGIAQRARLRGEVEAKVILNRDGSVNAVQFAPTSAQASLALFYPDVERALRQSKFSSGCGVEAVTLVFEFHTPANLRVGDSYRAISFKYPNRFEIIAPPPTVQ